MLFRLKSPKIATIFYCAKRHFRWYVTEIDRSVFFLSCFLSGEDGRDNWAHKYRLAELIVGFRGSENTSKTMFFTQIPLLVRLIEVFVVENRLWINTVTPRHVTGPTSRPNGVTGHSPGASRPCSAEWCLVVWINLSVRWWFQKNILKIKF